MEDILKKLREDLTKDWTEEDWCKYEQSCVKKLNIDNIIKFMMENINKLGWIQNINGQPFIHLADVEKTIYGILDPIYRKQILLWVKNKSEGSETSASPTSNEGI